MKFSILGEVANGAAASGPAQYRAMNGVCKIPLCRKIREKLKVQKAGRESRDLSEIWRTPKLWEAIRDYLGKVSSLTLWEAIPLLPSQIMLQNGMTPTSYRFYSKFLLR